MAKRRRSTRPKKAPHRPLKLTEKVVADACRGFSQGLYLRTVAAIVGVQARTLRGWIKRGRDELDRVQEDPRRHVRKSEALYVSLYSGVEAARAAFEAKHVALLDEVAGGYVHEYVKEVVQVVRIQDGEDDEGNPLYKDVEKSRTVTTQRKPVRAYQASVELLKRRFPDRWGERGPDSGGEAEPVEIGFNHDRLDTTPTLTADGQPVPPPPPPPSDLMDPFSIPAAARPEEE